MPKRSPPVNINESEQENSLYSTTESLIRLFTSNKLY